MSSHPLLPPSADPSAPRRLFCFPHAGGGTALFYRWRRYLPNDLALVPLRLPGREERLTDTPYTNLEELADQAVTAIRSLGNAPFALVGHSLGGYVAYEIAHRLATQGGPFPSLLVVAACGAPRSTPPKDPIGQLPDDQFLAEVASRYQGIPTEVQQDATLLAMVLPALRADMQMIEQYLYQPRPPVPVDLVALGGADDPGVAVHRLQQWQTHTSGRFTVRLFPGDHFFLHPDRRRRAGTSSAASSPESFSTAPPAPLQFLLQQVDAALRERA